VAETKAAAAAAAAASTTQAPTSIQATTSVEADWNTLGIDMEMDMNIDLDDPTLLDPGFDMPSTGFGVPDMEPSPANNLYSQELLQLGLDEPLPPQDMIDEL